MFRQTRICSFSAPVLQVLTSVDVQVGKMNPVLSDPNVKINMSLDEIIHLNKGQINSQLSRRGGRNGSRKKRGTPDNSEHSVPLLSSPCGVGIYVSKKSSLLNAEHKRRITEAISNRAINSALIEKSKEIIPAEYKLVRTSKGVERVLVPVEHYFSKSPPNKLVPPRKLNKQQTTSREDTLPDKPPPLVTTPIYNPPPQPVIKMEVDEDNEIAVLNYPQSGNQCEVIDVESNLPLDVLEVKKLCVPGPSLMPDGTVKTLSERFTMLTGNFQF